MFALPEAIVGAALILAIAMVLSARIVAWSVSAQQSSSDRSFPMLPPLPPMPPLPPEAFPTEPSGIPIDEDTPLDIGAAVLAQWHGLWWRAEIIDLLSDGRVRIHYLGWSSMWDATFAREELQRDISGSIKD